MMSITKQEVEIAENIIIKILKHYVDMQFNAIHKDKIPHIANDIINAVNDSVIITVGDENSFKKLARSSGLNKDGLLEILGECIKIKIR